MAIGSPALLYVDWQPKIIYITKAYMSVVQSTPTEIRELNTSTLHADLRDLEDDETGVVFLDTHDFVGPISLGGVSLAQVISIINGYTITFEESSIVGSPLAGPTPYAVNLSGSNNNIADVTNVNTVSIRSSNTAGLTYSKQIEDQSFEDARVWVNTSSGVSGTQFPIGTPGTPSSNASDAVGITVSRTLPYRYHFTGSLAFPGNDPRLSGVGVDMKSGSHHNASIVFGVGGSPVATRIDVTNWKFDDVTIRGYLTGEATWQSCAFRDVVDGFGGDAYSCGLGGTIVLDSVALEAKFINCYSAVAGTGTPTLDCNNLLNLEISFRKYSGGINITNFSDPDGAMTIDLNSGHAKLDPTCTGGTIVVRGTGHLTDNSGPNCTVVKAGLTEGWRVQDLHGGQGRTIYVDTTAATNGNGYISTPYDNITEGLARAQGGVAFPGTSGDSYDSLAEAIHVHGAVTIGGSPQPDATSLIIAGSSLVSASANIQTTTLIDVDTVFASLDITGIFNGRAIIRDSLVRSSSASSFVITGSLFLGATLTVEKVGSPVSTTPSLIDSCRDTGSFNPSTFDFNNATLHNLLVADYVGNLALSNMGATNTATVNLHGGKLTINASCSGGSVTLTGIGQLVDNSGGAVTVNEDNLIYQAGSSNFGGMG